MTFWPRFSFSRNDIRNLVKIKDLFALRPAPSTEFRRGSHCDVQIGCGPHICKVLPGCIMTHSKTSINLHIIVLYWALRLGTGLGGEAGKRVGVKNTSSYEDHVKCEVALRSYYFILFEYFFH